MALLENGGSNRAAGARPNEMSSLISSTPPPRTSSPPDAPTKPAGEESPLFRRTIALLLLLCLFVDTGGSLLDTPEVRLFEMAVCRDYYREHDPSVIGPPPLSYVDEKLCKLDSIQVDLAYLRAVKGLLATVPGILFGIPFGRLSDKIGRRPVLALGSLGAILSIFWDMFVCYYHQAFPTRLVLLSPLFLVIGGGTRVLTATLYATIVDVCPTELRTTIFYIIGSAAIITDIVMAPTGSWLLNIDLWLPYKFASALLLSGFIFIFAMPETRTNRGEAINATNTPQANGSAPGAGLFSEQTLKSINNQIRKALAALSDSWSNKQIRICFLLIFLFSFASRTGSIEIQYTSRVLDWPISMSGYVISINGIVTMLTLLSLAGLTQLASRRVQQSRVGDESADESADENGDVESSIKLDVGVVRMASVALAVGAMLIGVARVPPILVAGTMLQAAGLAMYQTLQGLLASFADKTSAGQVYASAAIIELAGRLSGGIAFAKFWQIGLGIPYPWGIGFPYFIAAVLHMINSLVSVLLPTEGATRAG